ncbi:MAG: peptidoglycan-associated lipoprotein Pal [Betaproteobacteria bacterium]|nr:peptidoglycan-associated lipoprotein Pal [Betaproteobacteria bacterium]
MKTTPNQLATLAAAVAVAVLAGCSSTPPVQQAPAPQTAAPTQAPSQPAPTTATASTGNVKATPTVAAPVASSVYFDYDQSAIKDQYAGVVKAYASYLAAKGNSEQLEGNCDERGSREYNMALGQKRADSVKKALTALGVKAGNIETVSYGEDKPKAKGHDEAAWAENRRVDFVAK